MESQILTTPYISTPTAAAFNFEAWMHEQLQRTEQSLSQWVGVNAPADLGQAIR